MYKIEFGYQQHRPPKCISYNFTTIENNKQFLCKNLHKLTIYFL